MNCFYFDISQAGYSIIGAMLSEETGTLMIMADTFTKIDEKAVGYMLKDRYHEIRKVRFIKDEHPVLPSQPTYVDRFKEMVFSDKHYVIGWNMADKVNRLENLDNLGCIAVWKSVHRTDAKTVFKAHRHIVDISTLNPKSNRNLELQGLYQLDFIKSSPEFDECGTDMENMKLIESVTSRVIAVRNLFQSPVYKGAFETHRNLIERYDLDNLISDTSANIAANIITENGKKPVTDSNIISYDYPTKQGTVNMLDEFPLTDEVHDFYAMLEKRVIGSRNDLDKFYEDYADAHGINGRITTVNAPIGENGAYQTFSIGGGHGSRAETVNPFEKPRNVIEQYPDVTAIDADGLYPTLAVNLGIYGKAYDDVLTERVAIKKSLPAERSEWTSEDRKKYRLMKDLKGVLNPPTGKSNTFSPHAKLPLDNSIISMRCIGNMLIYGLALEMVKLGAEVIFVNTDGIKVTNGTASSEAINDTVTEFAEKYGLSFEVKKLKRLIVKDTNNTIEWGNNGISNVTGKLGKGYEGQIPLDARIDHPVIVDKTVVRWFDSHADWQSLTEYDARAFFEEFLTYQAEHAREIEWCLFVADTEKQSYAVDGRPLKKPLACVLSPEGHHLTCMAGGKERKITGWTSQTVSVLGVDKKREIDIRAYVEWCMNVYRQWFTPRSEQTSLELDNIRDEPSDSLNKNSVLYKMLTQR